MSDDTTSDGTIPSHALAGDTGMSASAKFALVVVEGPDVGRSIEIDGARPGAVLVGQGEACDLRLTDRQASRRHASFDLGDRHLRVTDLASTNGTTVQGVSIVEAIVRGGEIVRMGETAIRVDLLTRATFVSVSAADRFGRVLGAAPEMRRLYPLPNVSRRATCPW